MIVPIARAVRNGKIIGNNRLAIEVDSPDEWAVRNGAIRKHRHICIQWSLAVIVPIARAVRNGIIAFNNRLASVVGSRYERAIRNGTTRQHAQVIGRLMVITFCPRSQGPLET